ncbi:teneurin-a isoform X6 [Vespula squamosa]|uniref:Teneurin-a isoform X6 n=1 Tax=Vespula squamosa TaxID=30214 RepID=A0ABD2A909_VESSQ
MESEGTLGRGHSNGGRGLRRQRSLEWRERRGYGHSAQSSSDDEEKTHRVVGPATTSTSNRGARSPGQVFASILAQHYGVSLLNFGKFTRSNALMYVAFLRDNFVGRNSDSKTPDDIPRGWNANERGLDEGDARV